MSKFGKWEYSDSSMISIPTSLLPTSARNWYRVFDRKEKTGIALVPLENNARLIAAAPDMYKILDGLIYKLKANGADEREEIDEAIKEIERLIERIDGKENEA